MRGGEVRGGEVREGEGRAGIRKDNYTVHDFNKARFSPLFRVWSTLRAGCLPEQQLIIEPSVQLETTCKTDHVIPGKKYPSTTGPKGNKIGFENTCDCASKTSCVDFVLTHAFNEFTSHPTASAKLLKCDKVTILQRNQPLYEIVLTIVKLYCH